MAIFNFDILLKIGIPEIKAIILFRLTKRFVRDIQEKLLSIVTKDD